MHFVLVLLAPPKEPFLCGTDILELALKKYLHSPSLVVCSLPVVVLSQIPNAQMPSYLA